MKQERRGSWYLLTGVILGLVMGLVYSWVISPVRYVNAPPYALRQDYQDEYRALIAAAYLYKHDLARAQQRLANLKDDESAQAITMKAQQALAEGYPDDEVRALGILALALTQGLTPKVGDITSTAVSTPVPAFGDQTATPLFIEPSVSPTVTPTTEAAPLILNQTPQPSIASGPSSAVNSTPTQGAAFTLQERRLVCNPQQPEPLIQVQINDAEGQPVSGIEFLVRWEGGEDQFYTGLKPELGMGYGDFRMIPGGVYSITPVNGGQVIEGLKAAECTSEAGNVYWGSWLLSFEQP